jgi:hypothetical protein
MEFWIMDGYWLEFPGYFLLTSMLSDVMQGITWCWENAYFSSPRYHNGIYKISLHCFPRAWRKYGECTFLSISQDHKWMCVGSTLSPCSSSANPSQSHSACSWLTNLSNIIRFGRSPENVGCSQGWKGVLLSRREHPSLEHIKSNAARF